MKPIFSKQKTDYQTNTDVLDFIYKNLEESACPPRTFFPTQTSKWHYAMPRSILPIVEKPLVVIKMCWLFLIPINSN